MLASRTTLNGRAAAHGPSFNRDFRRDGLKGNGILTDAHNGIFKWAGSEHEDFKSEMTTVRSEVYGCF